jgi:hypothetical protein
MTGTTLLLEDVTLDPSTIVAAFPGAESVVVVKHPSSFAVLVAEEREVFFTPGEEDADFAAACAFAVSEAARIYRENA